MTVRHFMDIGGILRDMLAAGECEEGDHVWGSTSEGDGESWTTGPAPSEGYERDRGAVAELIADADQRDWTP
jgi:hypothetical protein